MATLFEPPHSFVSEEQIRELGIPEEDLSRDIRARGGRSRDVSPSRLTIDETKEGRSRKSPTKTVSTPSIDEDDNKELQDHLKRMDRQIDKLTTLIKSLLDVSRVRTGK